MGDKIGQNPKGEKNTSKKLDDLKGMIDEYNKFIPDELETPIKENIEMAKKLFQVKELIDKALDYVDVDIDLMEHLDDIKEVLKGIKGAAEWLKKSTQVNDILETIEDLVFYLDLALNAIKMITSNGPEWPETPKYRQQLKEALTKISEIIDKAIAAIDFVQKLQKINLKDIGWDTLDQLKALTE